MDGNPAATGITRADSITHRCAWCGLTILAEEATLPREHALCGACVELLRGVDWTKLLAASPGEGLPANVHRSRRGLSRQDVGDAKRPDADRVVEGERETPHRRSRRR